MYLLRTNVCIANVFISKTGLKKLESESYRYIFYLETIFRCIRGFLVVLPSVPLFVSIAKLFYDGDVNGHS